MTSSNKITSVESSFERLMRRPQLLRENGRWIGLICRKWDYGWWLSPLRQYRLSDCIIGTCLHHVNIAAKNSTYHPYASFMFVSLTNGESCRCLGDSLISIFLISDIYIFHVYPTSPHTLWRCKPYTSSQQQLRATKVSQLYKHLRFPYQSSWPTFGWRSPPSRKAVPFQNLGPSDQQKRRLWPTKRSVSSRTYQEESNNM